MNDNDCNDCKLLTRWQMNVYPLTMAGSGLCSSGENTLIEMMVTLALFSRTAHWPCESAWDSRWDLVIRSDKNLSYRHEYAILNHPFGSGLYHLFDLFIDFIVVWGMYPKHTWLKWFGTMTFYDFPFSWEYIMIPIDEVHHFSEG